MSKKLTTEEFAKKAKEIHGDKYDYSLVDYKGYDKKIKIICSTHGVFEQSPDSHLRGQACPVCGKEKLSMLFSFPQEQLIKRAKEIHGDKYDYSLVDYKNNKTKIKIICPIHGIFEQVPVNHLRGSGCPICNESHGEKKISKWLNDNGYFLNKDYFREFKFKDLKSKNNVCLRFDFYIPKKNLLIEYQGEQHYKSFDFSKMKRAETEKFHSLQENDRLKRNFCKERNIKELEIMFSEYENIESILDEALNDSSRVV